MTPLFKWLPHPEYANKLSFSIVYALLASIVVNFSISRAIFIPAALPVSLRSLLRSQENGSGFISPYLLRYYC